MLESLLRFTALPNLHPAFVHFPIASLPLVLGFEIAGLFAPKRRWLAHAATTLYVCAAAAAWLAVWAGERAADSLASVPPRVQPRIADHSDWGHYALYSLLALAALRAAVHYLPATRDHRGARLAVVILALAALGVVAKAADLGGGLVYQHGVAVRADEGEPTTGSGDGDGDGSARASRTDPRSAADSGTAGSEPADASTRLVRQDDGTLVWTPAAGDHAALGEVMLAVPPSGLDSLTPVEDDGGADGLTLEVDGSTALLFPGAFSDVHVEATIRVIDWRGTIGVVHHLQNSGDGGYFTLSGDGTAVLFDRREGGREDLDQASVGMPSEVFRLAVSASGKHLKGLVDGETVTHGHVEPGPDGACGLYFDGSGRVEIRQAKVIPLG